jgi:hypothetical protein
MVNRKKFLLQLGNHDQKVALNENLEDLEVYSRAICADK